MPAIALKEIKPRERKRKLIEELIELMSSHKTIVLADISGLRALQFQRLRKALREGIKIKVAKNSIMRKAIDELMELRRMDFSPLKGFLAGQLALLASNLSPFEVYTLIEKNKVPAKARPGDIAVKDIIIPAGNTGIPAGPALSLFKKFKIPVKVEEGSIYVTKDTVVVKAGEAIPAEVAELLGKLGIEPMEAGLKIKAVFYEGSVFRPEDLKIDVEGYKKRIADAFARALSLAINAVFVTAESAPYIISRAVAEARNLAINACYPTREVVGYIIAKAHAQAIALKDLLKL